MERELEVTLNFLAILHNWTSDQTTTHITMIKIEIAGGTISTRCPVMAFSYQQKISQLYAWVRAAAQALIQVQNTSATLTPHPLRTYTPYFARYKLCCPNAQMVKATLKYHLLYHRTLFWKDSKQSIQNAAALPPEKAVANLLGAIA